MYLVRIYVPSCARAYCFLFRIGVVGICICYGAIEDEVCGLAAVLVWRVVRVAARKSGCIHSGKNVVDLRAISPGKYMAESPGTDLALCFFS